MTWHVRGIYPASGLDSPICTDPRSAAQMRLPRLMGDSRKHPAQRAGCLPRLTGSTGALRVESSLLVRSDGPVEFLSERDEPLAEAV